MTIEELYESYREYELDNLPLISYYIGWLEDRLIEKHEKVISLSSDLRKALAEIGDLERELKSKTATD